MKYALAVLALMAIPANAANPVLTDLTACTTATAMETYMREAYAKGRDKEVVRMESNGACHYAMMVFLPGKPTSSFKEAGITYEILPIAVYAETHNDKGVKYDPPVTMYGGIYYKTPGQDA